MTLRRLKFFAVLWVAAIGLFAAAGGAWAQQGDSQYGVYVQDDAGVISQQTKDALYRQAIWLHEQTGTAQIGVVTADKLGGKTLEEYSVAKFRELGLGSKDRNDGVMLLYTKEGNHVRVEIGYGMEGRIPDGKAGAILDQYFVPNRDAGHMDAAFLQTQTALIREMAAEYGVDPSSIGSADTPAPAYEGHGTNFWSSMPWYFKWVAGLIIVMLIVLDFKFTGGAVTYAILSMVGRRGSSGGGGGWGGGRGGGGSSGGGGANR
ncbi:MAG: hypothetical protein JWR03_1549 [Cohnella sp.]|nr:hypothetical protein [Cohnella sp.]